MKVFLGKIGHNFVILDFSKIISFFDFLEILKK